MQWHVIDSIKIKNPDYAYALVLNSGGLTVIARAQTNHTIEPGAVLSPLLDALYSINGDKAKTMKAAKITKFCLTYWELLRKEHGLHSIPEALVLRR
nr:hypothetical protein [Serratia sp. PAMC26656]